MTKAIKEELRRESDSGGSWWFWLLLLWGFGVFDGADDQEATAEKVDNKPKVVQTAAMVEEPKMLSQPEEVPLKTAEELFEGAFEEGDTDPFQDTFDENLFDQ